MFAIFLLSVGLENQRKIDKTSINNYVFNNPLDTQSHNINNSNYIKNNNDDNLAFVYDKFNFPLENNNCELNSIPYLLVEPTFR